MSRFSFVLWFAVAAAACKGKDDPKASPTAGSAAPIKAPASAPAGSNAGSSASVGSGSSLAGSNATGIAPFAEASKLVLGTDKLAANADPQAITWTVGDDAVVIAVVHAGNKARVVAFDEQNKIVEIDKATFAAPYDPGDGSIRFIARGDKLAIRMNPTSGNSKTSAEALLLRRDEGFAPTYPGGIHVDARWKGAMEEKAPFEPN